VAAVSNSSPLIYLAALGDLELLPQLFGRIAIPEAVHREVVVAGSGQSGAEAVARAQHDWLTVESIKDRRRAETLMNSPGLDVGEAEAIILAQELSHSTIILDDQSAVTLARSFGLSVVRTAALYVAAKKEGLIQSVQPKLDALRLEGFWLKDTDYFTVLAAADEFPIGGNG